jgi:hypothetical protein
MIPLDDERLNALPETTAEVIASSDCDSVAVIRLPKQLELDDGAADLLDWFKRTVAELGWGANAQRDARCNTA